MSTRYQAGIIRPGYDALKVPNAPTIGTATAGDAQASVTFTAPSCVGGGAISSYQAFACCGARSAFGSSSPLTVTGLTNGAAYTFKVIANNVYGPSYPSAASNSITPAVQPGQQAYTTAGTYSWIAPAGITSVSVVAVGGGGGAGQCSTSGAGGLGYKNNYTVTPGNSYSVVVGAGGVGADFGCETSGGQSYFVSTCVVAGFGGKKVSPCGRVGGSYAGDGGGTGGLGGRSNCGSYGGGGAGAGGYSGNGGAGGQTVGGITGGGAGSGGGGGGGAVGFGSFRGGGGGGGVGILGQGSNGTGTCGTGGTGGGGGSGGANGATGTACYHAGAGGAYGGSAGGHGSYGARGGGGAVRIIWPGTTRTFPSTNTGDL